jgi:hypothetical protein
MPSARPALWHSGLKPIISAAGKPELQVGTPVAARVDTLWQARRLGIASGCPPWAGPAGARRRNRDRATVTPAPPFPGAGDSESCPPAGRGRNALPRQCAASHGQCACDSESLIRVSLRLTAHCLGRCRSEQQAQRHTSRMASAAVAVERAGTTSESRRPRARLGSSWTRARRGSGSIPAAVASGCAQRQPNHPAAQRASNVPQRGPAWPPTWTRIDFHRVPGGRGGRRAVVAMRKPPRPPRRLPLRCAPADQAGLYQCGPSHGRDGRKIRAALAEGIESSERQGVQLRGHFPGHQ